MDNELLSGNKLTDNVLIIIRYSSKGISNNDLFKKVYPISTGKILIDELNETIELLKEEGFVKINNNYVFITAKGIKMCENVPKEYSNSPYSYLMKVEILKYEKIGQEVKLNKFLIRTRMFTLIAAIISLVISIVSFYNSYKVQNNNKANTNQNQNKP